MKTIVQVLAALSLLGAPSLAAAGTLPWSGPQRATRFQALEPRATPLLEIVGSPSFGTGEDSLDTTTGGPVGGIN